MYRPPAYVQDDIATLHGAIRKRSFATIAAFADGEVRFAYAPVVLDEHVGKRGALRFHLARANPLAVLDGAKVRLGFLGPDSYVSPDWYETKGLVPTWNYVAVEAAGCMTRLDDSGLRRLLVDLSAAEEEKLRPKRPWTVDKVPPEKMHALLSAIVGFSVALDSLEGKFKLSQDKKRGDIEGVVANLEASGAHATARAMRQAAKET